jgi:peptide/nickel transport system permease protein
MGAFILRRLLQTAIVLFLVTVLIFIIIHSIPGDPVLNLVGPGGSQEQIAYYTQLFGLDKPLPVQYTTWVANLLRGKMGTSLGYRQDVGELIAQRIQVTVSIAVPAFLLAALIGLPFGIISAVKRGGFLDSLITVLANLGMSTPIFWLGILGIYLFSLKLGWLPVQGYTKLSDNFVMGIKQMILPVATLAFIPLSLFARQTRSSMLEVLGQDYIRTGRSKGLKESVIIYQHALKNAMVPVITVMGMQLGQMVGGSILVEQVFNIPGMGNLLALSITNRDYQVVQACIFIIALTVAICNLAVDIAYGYIDPRIRIK